MRPLFIRAALAAFAFVPSPTHAQSGAFIVRLGADTVVVESYATSGDQITGTLVRRTPITTVTKYTITLGAGRMVTGYEQQTFLPNGTPSPNAPAKLSMSFTGDSVVRHVMQNGQPVTLRAAAPKGTLPSIGASWAAYQMQIHTAKRDGAVYTIGFSPQQAAPTKLDVRLIGADSAEVVTQGFRTGFRLDQSMHIARGDGSLTTQKFIVTPVQSVDANAIAMAWGAKEAAGAGLGAASTRDTLNAVVGGANIWIDYGRPAKRGREIWGKLVPNDTTWRFGANAATQFKTDKDVEIGGVTVPAGFYSLWLYPSAGKSYLIVNTQTGQWGTAYDASKDLVKIPVEAHMALSTSEERFRIFLAGDKLMMHWDKGGYGTTIRAK